jgi:hypothetical protein
LSDYRVIADGQNEAVSEVDNVFTCSKFRPRLSTDLGLKRYFDMYKIGNDKFKPRSYGDTASVTYDSNMIIVSNTSDYQVGQFIIFDAYPDKAYLIRRIRGIQVFLAQLVDLPTSSYNYSVAILDNIEDDLNNTNILTQSVLNLAPEVIWYQNIKSLSLLKQPNEYLDIVPIINSSLSKLSLITVVKLNNDGVIFSHSDGNSSHINFQSNSGFAETSQVNTNSVLNQSQFNSNYQTALFTFVIEFDTLTSDYTVSAGINGEFRIVDIGNTDTINVSANQLIGIMFDTLGLVNGFDGQLSDMIFTESTDNFTVRRYEGFLAYKLGLVNLLPNSHPYKNTQP